MSNISPETRRHLNAFTPESERHQTIPTYLHDLRGIILTAPPTDPINHNTLDQVFPLDDILLNALTQVNAHLNGPNGNAFEGVVNNYAHVGIAVENGVVTFRPVAYNKLQQIAKDQVIFVHYGSVFYPPSNPPIDNLKNLRYWGVFGQSDPHAPTSLQLISSSYHPSAPSWPRSYQPVTLYIDGINLLNYRQVFSHPAGLIEKTFTRRKRSDRDFITFGGIPATAIIAIAQTPTSPTILIENTL